MAAQVLLLLMSIGVSITGTSAWRCAKYQHYFSQQPEYIDCVWDCCGNSFQRHCCAPTGVIVGCSIAGAVILAFLVMMIICWWQKRRVRYSQGPRLLGDRRAHSHYPVAPKSVTRPSTFLYEGPDPNKGYKPPQNVGLRQEPVQGYHPPPRSEKSLLQEHYGDQRGPASAGYRQEVLPPASYRQGPPPPVGFRQEFPPPVGFMQAAPPSAGYRQEAPPSAGFRQAAPPSAAFRQEAPPSHVAPPAAGDRRPMGPARNEKPPPPSYSGPRELDM